MTRHPFITIPFSLITIALLALAVIAVIGNVQLDQNVAGLATTKCGTHGRLQCVTGPSCQSGLQACNTDDGAGKCYSCCADTTRTCGNPPIGRCQANDAKKRYYDPDCSPDAPVIVPTATACGTQGKPHCASGQKCQSGLQACTGGSGAGKCYSCCEDADHLCPAGKGCQSADRNAGYYDPDCPSSNTVTIPVCSGGSKRGVCLNSGPVNTFKNKVAEARTPADIQYLLDQYYLPGKSECNDGWGHQWLSKFVIYLLGIRAYEMQTDGTTVNDLSATQLAQLKTILADAARECTFYLDNCGPGGGNFCAEDYAGFVMSLAMTKNLYPDVPIDTGLEEKYLGKMFTDKDGVIIEKKTWDAKPEVKMYNHGEENPHYGGLLFVHLNNARYTYLLSGRTLPGYYKQQNMAGLFQWVQSKALADGSAYLPDQCHTTGGAVRSCDDARVAKATPRINPGGRYLRGVYGANAFSPNRYTFETFDEINAAGNFDVGRKMMYNTYNPR